MLTIFTIVPDNLFENVSKFWLNVIIDWKFSSIDDTHIHSLLNGMIKEDRVESLTQVVQASEGEGEV